jgi:hypothetical protein
VSVLRLSRAPRSSPPQLVHPVVQPGSPLFTRHVAVLEAAVGLWLFAIAGTKLDSMAGLGLLDALPIAFFGAVTLIIVGFAVAASQEGTSPTILGGYVVGLAVMLHGTTPLLYDVPRYPWTYKHIGVTEFIAAEGHVDRTLDVYQNWPGFLALGAWLSRATGLTPIHFAAWAQLFFALAGIAALLFALRAVTDNPAVTWTAVWLFLITDWIGQNYYSSQSLGFLLSLIVLGLCLRYAPVAREPRASLGRRLARPRRGPPAWLERIRRAGRPPRAEAVLSPRAALCVGAACYAAIVVSHQLSPILLILQVAALTLLLGRVPVWVLGGMIALEAGWVALAYPFVERLDLLSFSPGAVPQSGFSRDDGLAGVTVVLHSRTALMAGIVGLAVVGAIRAHRSGSLRPAVLALACAPAVAVALQPYGGEGVLRAYLFGLPWICVLAALALLPVHGRRPGGRPVLSGLLACGVVLGALFLLAYYGTEERNYLTTDDVAVASWFERNAPAGASATLVLPVHAGSLTRNYAEFGGPGEFARALIDFPQFRGHQLGAQDVPAIRRLLASDDAKGRYVLFTPVQERVSRLYSVLPEGSFDSLQRALENAPDFALVYRRGRGSVFKYMPGTRLVVQDGALVRVPVNPDPRG